MRLFFAIMLPPEIQHAIGRLRAELDWLPIRGNWTATPNLHITLKFLGEIQDDAVADLAAAVKTRIPAAGSVTLQTAGLELFPPHAAARVLGVGFSGEVGRLTELAASLEQLAEDYGVTREQRPYVAHATLARFRDGLQTRHHARIETLWSRFGPDRRFAVEEFQLMQSTLGSCGPEYAIAARFLL